MFTVRKKYEVSVHELIDFMRLIGRFGLKFKIGDEYVVKDENDKVTDRLRTITVFGTRKQLSELMEAQDIVYEYTRH